jgi:dolichol-phosphate mannosyltransferase
MPSSQVCVRSFEFRPRRTKYCLVIPVLNEAGRLSRQLAKMGPQMDLVDTILVDGASTDGSIEPQKVRPCGVRTLFIRKGTGGLSAQLRLGLAYALREGYLGCIVMDGNDKDNPEAIERFIRALDEGFDHVQGSRYCEGGREQNTPWLRRMAIRYIHAPLVSAFAGFRYTDTTNGFRAYSRALLTHPGVQPFREELRFYELHPYLAVRAPLVGLKVKEIPVERRYPAKGRVPTKISPIGGNLLILRSLIVGCLQRFDRELLRP